jgi:hypothetical protein
MKLRDIFQSPTENNQTVTKSITPSDLTEIIKIFLPTAKQILELDKLPKIILKKSLTQDDQPSQGRFNDVTYALELAVANRQPVDILRTLAHELVHAKQHRRNVAIDGTTGSPDENQAHALAGIIMREFNKAHPEFLKLKPISEGGNVSYQSPGWQGAPGQHKADEIDLKLHNRTLMVGKIHELLVAMNQNFESTYGRPIWDPKLLNTREALSGSTIEFFNIKGVSDEDFLNKLKKTKVGDIDTQVDQEIGEQVREWLKSVIGKKIGPATFLGFNASLSGLWKLDDPPVRVQVDFELGPYKPAAGKEPAKPTDWFKFSHSSDYTDMAAGIKGVFHKYIYRAIPYAQASTKYVARVLKKSTKISPEPVTDSDYSFAVASGQGGGISSKYKPYIDPETGQPKEIDGIPVMQLLDPSQRDYDQNLSSQFQKLFGRKPTAEDLKLQQSFVGTLQLANKYLDEQGREEAAKRFLDICFGPGAQMLTANDPVRDRDTKFAAVDAMLLGGGGITALKIADAKGLRQQAVKMAMDYEQAHESKKKPVTEAIGEAGEDPAVKAQLRKGMPHLRDLKSVDFLDLLDELHQGNGQFQLKNIPLNVKVDGFGGRFGKDKDGKPFMGTSRTEPRYKAGFLDYHQKKGTTDPDVLGRAQLFDQLFEQMMKAIKLVDSKLGPKFLINKQVTCEVLYLPFATQTPEGKLKFVGIHYDKLPDGVELALVPFRVVQGDTGEDLPDSEGVIKALTGIGKGGSVMFIDNSLTQNEALDVTAIVPPLENIEQMKAMLASKKRDQAAEVKAALGPVKQALEDAIIKDPNIIGKDMLGKDYEGIVINSRMGPIKITSQEQRDIIADKNAAKVNARTERPRGENKTAVVAIGSFVGHVGHEQLFDYTVKKAAEVGGDPYLFIGNAVGKDDPIPVDIKVQTWHKLYPKYASNISAVTQAGGTLIQKIKHELINPLPGKPPRYDNVIVMVGEDQAGMNIANALMKAVNKFAGYEHVKVSLEATPRGTGMSFTKLRDILKDPNATPQQQLAVWEKGFDVKKLGRAWIMKLIELTKQGMDVKTPAPTTQQKVAAPVETMAGVGMGNYVVDKSTMESASGVIATKAQANDPRYSMSLTKDVRPGQIEKNLRAFSLTDETMSPDSSFTSSKKNKLGTAGQLKATAKRPARQGDLVGESYNHINFNKIPLEPIWEEQEEDLRQDLLKNPRLFENSTDYKNLQHFLKQHTPKDIQKGNSYVYVSVTSILPAHNLSIVHFAQPYKLVKIENNRAYFNVDGEIKQYPEGNKLDGDLLKSVFLFPSIKEFEKFQTMLGLKFSDWSIKTKTIEQNVDEAKQRLDPKCWKGYRKSGTKMKGGTRVNNCVKIGEGWEEVIANAVDKLLENFADGKKPGRKGLAKRSGVNTKASVSSLRKTAKNSSGEKARMAHWMANMKAGKAKKK